MTNHSATPTKSREWLWLGLVFVLALTAVLYAELWNAPPLAWDDDSNIFANPYFRMGMWWGVWTEPYFGLYVPVTSSVWAALLKLGAGDAWPFRALNLVLHLANTLLVFSILKTLARRWRLENLWPIVLATAVFALHPVQVQAVAWISGGRDLLAAFFTLLATLVYFGRRTRAGYSLATVLYVLALLSKPSVAVVPAVIFVAELVIDKAPWKKAAPRMLPWLAAATVAIVLTQLGQGAHFENLAAWWQRPELMADAYGFYVLKTFWPHPLSANYDRTPPNVLASHDWLTLIALAAAVGASLVATLRERRAGLILLWFLLLLPVSGVVPFAYENIGGVADHYMYLPLAALTPLLLLALQKRWTVLIAIPVLAVLAYLSWQRVPVWEGDTNFFTDMAKKAPESYNTAIGMSIVECRNLKNYDEGLRWIEKALTKHPTDILALANEAFCYTEKGEAAKVVEMKQYLKFLDKPMLKATQPTAYSSLLASIGKAHFDLEKLEEGYVFICEAYRVKPAEPNHLHNVEAAARLLKQRGLKTDCPLFPY